MLAVVQEQQHVLATDELQQAVLWGAPRLIRQPQYPRRGDRQQIGVGDRCQIDVPRSVGIGAGDAGGDLHRQPGLADAAGTSQRHQPVVRENVAHLYDFRVASHEAGQLDRKMLGNNGFAHPEPRELIAQIGMA
jgi:hypothetical protein